MKGDSIMIFIKNMKKLEFTKGSNSFVAPKKCRQKNNQVTVENRKIELSRMPFLKMISLKAL